MSQDSQLSQLNKDLFEVKEFWKNSVSSCYHYLLENRDLLGILADKEIIGTVKKYDGDDAKEVAYKLILVASDFKDSNPVVEMSRTIRKYDGLVAREVANRLALAAADSKNKDVVVEMSRILASDEIVDTVKKYDGDVAKEIVGCLAWASNELKDSNPVVEISRTVRKYDGEVAGTVAYWLGWVGRCLIDGDDVVEMSRILASDEIVDTVKKYDGDVAREVADRFCRSAYYLKDKDVIVEMSRTIRKYGDTAREVAYRLDHAAAELKDKNKLVKIIKLLNKVGKSMFDILYNTELYTIIDQNLDRLVKDRDSFDAVATYVKSGRRLPAPTESNMEDYKKIALDYVKSNYGIAKDISMNQLLMLFVLDDKIVKEAVDLVNRSKESNHKYYSLKASNARPLHYSRDELLRYSVVSIVGSRDKAREQMAVAAVASIVGDKAVNRARNSFNERYRRLTKDIVAAFNWSDYGKAYDILRQTKDEAMLDVLNAANYRDVDIGGTNFVKAVESNNPLDYDNRVQIACVYLPAGAKEDDGILEYCRDDRFTLVRYDVGSQTLGSAICYSEDDIFLVDSVEGHRNFRKPEIFEIVYNDVVERARERKARLVVFNRDALNKTPKEFLEHLKGKHLLERTVRMKLDAEGYLESEEDGVNGYVV